MKVKKMVFIGGEAGVGKSTVASHLQKNIINHNITVVDKDEATSEFVSFVLETNNHNPYDRESEFYTNTVKPLEYKQLNKITLHSIKNSSVITTAPYFDCFTNKQWIEEMKFEAEFNEAELFFFYLVKDKTTILQGLKDRNAQRDYWKLKNWEVYRKSIDALNENISKNINIIKINMSESFSYFEIEKILKVNSL
jgi:gluconate kinase